MGDQAKGGPLEVSAIAAEKQLKKKAEDLGADVPINGTSARRAC